MTSRRIIGFHDGMIGIAACPYCLGTGRKATAATTINEPCVPCLGAGHITCGFNYRAPAPNGELAKDSEK